MERKSNKGLVFLIVLLVIIILGLVCYICYDKGLFSNLPQGEEPRQETKLSISDGELNKLLETVPIAVYPIGSNSTVIDAYSNNGATIGEVSTGVLLVHALKNIAATDFVLDQQSNIYYYSFEKANEQLNANYKSFDTGRIFDASDMKRLVGSVLLENEICINEETCGDLLHYDSRQKIDGLVLETFQKSRGKVYKSIVNKYENNGDVIVEQRIAALYHPIDFGDKYALYTSTNGDTSIYNPSSEDDAEKYFNENPDKFNVYKQTFKKADDGKYYWYSSEVVNK